MLKEITHFPGKTLIGLRSDTSLSNYAAPKLWPQFMPRRKEIPNLVSEDNFSVQLYNGIYSFKSFTPFIEFEYWAAVEVSDVDHIPAGMEVLEIPEGLYAIFIHKGPVTEFVQTLRFIHEQWLPTSGFEIDHRPHFEVLGKKYLGTQHPDSEEEVWVPIRAIS
ncbi:MAG: AraC family transcriptional regulator [Balneola sp.]|nr:MAG: AraC family transcriptional regulator [Balneola sp.]